MKKMLSVFLCTTLLFPLTSCSEGSTSSVPEMQTDAIDYTALDSFWECDYLKFGVNSNWKSDESISGDMTFVSWHWGSGDDFRSFRLVLSHNSLYKKLTQNEATENWENTKEIMLTDDDFKNDETMREAYEGYSVESSFVKNGQAYLIISKEGKPVKKRIEFYANELHGEIYFESEDINIIKDVLETAVFY